MSQLATLYFFCGKMGAGKSTYSKQLASDNQAVRISEDEWLSMLYPDQINTFDDYLNYSALLKPLVKKHVVKLLTIGTDVVMDFPANTQNQRKWFVEIAAKASADYQLIFLDVTNTQCLQHLAKRREKEPERRAFDTEAIFLRVTDFFEAPEPSENLNVLTIRTSGH